MIKTHTTALLIQESLKNKSLTLSHALLLDEKVFEITVDQLNLKENDFLFGQLDELACLIQDRLDKEILNCKTSNYEDTGVEYEYTTYFLELDAQLDKIQTLKNLL